MFAKGDPAAPRGLLLTGASGTGKSLIASSVAASLNANFQKLSFPTSSRQASEPAVQAQDIQVFLLAATNHPENVGGPFCLVSVRPWSFLCRMRTLVGGCCPSWSKRRTDRRQQRRNETAWMKPLRTTNRQNSGPSGGKIIL